MRLVRPGGEAPSFSYQVMLLMWYSPTTTSTSPSPSTSAAKTEKAPLAAVLIVRAVHPGGDAPLFSYQVILLLYSDADSASVSPSPSTSAAKTE